jgi:branched-chain amino acid transport system ATP-binding protein
MTTMLRVDHLQKHFGGLKVLTDVHFDVPKGQKLALIGPNGAGKSTLINVIGGQLPATGGGVYLGDKDITHMSPNKRLHMGVGRSYQVNNLFFHLSLQNNMLLALHGAENFHFQMVRSLEKRKDLVERVEKLTDAVGLYEKRHEPLGTLSYGDQRLVELLFAYPADPQLVLLDEPSAGLPTAEAIAFANKIRDLNGDTTLLFCAHDMDLVFNLADEIIVLCFGEIMTRGSCDDVSCDPKVREIYLGEEE